MGLTLPWVLHAAVGAQLSPAVRCNVALRGRGVQLGALGGCAAALDVVVTDATVEVVSAESAVQAQYASAVEVRRKGWRNALAGRAELSSLWRRSLVRCRDA